MLLVVLLDGCDDGDVPAVCEPWMCAPHGECTVERGVELRCDCDLNFVETEEGLTCEPDQEPLKEGRWVYIPSSAAINIYYMGSPEEEVGRAVDEVRHEVILTHDFIVLENEVSADDFLELMGYLPSASGLDPDNPDHLRRPVGGVTWHEAAAFCNEASINHERGRLDRCYECDGVGENVMCHLDPTFDSPYDCEGLRLPTEAEWEFAARAGIETATYNGDLDPNELDCEYNEILEPIAAFCANSLLATRPVRWGQPNVGAEVWGENWAESGGLYDMLGNVREWCSDYYAPYDDSVEQVNPWGPRTGDARVLRGGSHTDFARDIRAAKRFFLSAVDGQPNVGFRPVRTFDLP